MENPNQAGDTIRPIPVAGFSQRPVPRSAIEEILDLARRAPSGVNTQPWNVFVLQGRAQAALVEAATGVVPGLVVEAARQARFWQQFNMHPGASPWAAPDPQRARDEFLSAAMAAANGDAAQAQADLLRYFRFYDAPVGLVCTISRGLGSGSLLDYGMFLQNITLAARARGLHACVQTGWKGLADMVLSRLEAPEDALVVCGVALGYGDPAQPQVEPPADETQVEAFTTWHG